MRCGPIEDLALRDNRRHPAHMIRLKPLPDDVAILDQSHVFRGARLILAYVTEHGPIPLTPSKAFKLIFVNWAAEAFVWPHWTVARQKIWEPVDKKLTVKMC